MSKGEQTRAALIAQALDVASCEGLESLSFGELARQMGMSKTGVFSPFKSLTNLKLAVVELYRKKFESELFAAARHEPVGLPRLESLFLASVNYILECPLAGSFLISCAAEYDDRPGSLRDEIAKAILHWRCAFEDNASAAIELGQLGGMADPGQLAFELFSVILCVQHDSRLLGRRDCMQKAMRAYKRIIRANQPQRMTLSMGPAYGSTDFMHGAVCLIDSAAKGLMASVAS